ncbi:multiheme c-type cytochrome [Hydrogenimonas cancrithermarum]|uniref:Cytochrome c-552/4 domain-containing protein n=1 Tax=Hydrogenimonas cancrithermarum TaxID=2993563 RepID=A0ABN6WUL5_9BACT|nr:multiheme c-type cytochrome [Hydrogenimonas cancrithermarum]BDY12648.1 hypothetical protein HCR_09600 [Hydrogenimonas cancrithermarum]
MLRLTFLLIAALDLFATQGFVSSNVCKKCHPIISKEYSASMHKNASIHNDPVHRAVWEKHPLKKSGKYVCASCHTPTDTKIMQALKSKKSALPEENAIQKNEPIGCAYCHRIKDIEIHAKANLNILNETPKFYYASKEGKSEKRVVKFHEESSFFGLSKKTAGSPFHTIDYGNENFSDGKMCLGCHDHKRNDKGFAICSMDIESSEKSTNNCISCHMPQVEGSYSTIAKSKTHAYHGFTGLHNRPDMLKSYITLKATAKEGKLSVTLKNGADHKLFAHPLRLAQLRIEIGRDGKTIRLEPVNFFTILGHNGKPAMPWSADSILKQNVIKAHEEKRIDMAFTPRKGDEVRVTLGYYIVNPKAAGKLGITQKDFTTFRTLVSKIFFF